MAAAVDVTFSVNPPVVPIKGLRLELDFGNGKLAVFNQFPPGGAAAVNRRALLQAGIAAAGTLASSPLLGKPTGLLGGQPGLNPFHPPPPDPGGSLSLSIISSDGHTASFSQAAATRIEDYNGPFVQQFCFRQIATGYGDYRDAFMVDFRPDIVGDRQEIVVEFGTLYNFPINATPVSASGVSPLHLGLPKVPVFTKISGNLTAQAGSAGIALTYVTPDGETPASLVGTTLVVGDRLQVTSPIPAMNATHYNVYARIFGLSTGNRYYKQNASPILIGTGWTEPTSGLLLSGTDIAPIVTTRPRTRAYRATISGGSLPAPIVIDVPAHYWRSRWRWQSSPRPIMRTLANLVTMKAILPLTSHFAYGARLPARVEWKGPMDNGPVLQAMSAVGGRNDLGFMPEWHASYLVTLAENSRVSMLSAAEASGTMAIWSRDAATGALVNTSTVSRFPCYNDAFHGSQQIPTVPGSLLSWSYIFPNESHMPALCFTPWMLTDDPFFLEGAQAVALYGIMETNLSRANMHLPSMGSTASPRGWGWNLRDIFQMAGWSLDILPSWMLPKSFWRDHALPDCLVYAMKFVNNTIPGAAPGQPTFHGVTVPTMFPAFMLDYICLVMGFAKWCGKFPTWNPVVEFAALPRIVMSDPSDPTGWDHRQPEPYYMPFGVATTWPELWAYYLAIAPGKGWPSNPASWPVDGFAFRSGYAPWWRAALAALSLAGLPRAREGHDWTSDQLDKDHNFASVGYTWSTPPSL